MSHIRLWFLSFGVVSANVLLADSIPLLTAESLLRALNEEYLLEERMGHTLFPETPTARYAFGAIGTNAPPLLSDSKRMIPLAPTVIRWLESVYLRQGERLPEVLEEGVCETRGAHMRAVVLRWLTNDMQARRHPEYEKLLAMVLGQETVGGVFGIAFQAARENPFGVGSILYDRALGFRHELEIERSQAARAFIQLIPNSGSRAPQMRQMALQLMDSGQPLEVAEAARREVLSTSCSRRLQALD